MAQYVKTIQKWFVPRAHLFFGKLRHEESELWVYGLCPLSLVEHGDTNPPSRVSGKPSTFLRLRRQNRNPIDTLTFR